MDRGERKRVLEREVLTYLNNYGYVLKEWAKRDPT